MRIYNDSKDDIASGIRDYVEVYNSSWKNPEPYADFMPSLMQACVKCGTLLLGVLYVNDRPVAAQIWIVTSAKAIIYKLAYVEDQSGSSPGSILSKALFEIAINDYKPLEIDYGVGDESYKQDWMDRHRSLYSLHGYNMRTTTGLLLRISYHARTGLKLLLNIVRS